MGDKSDTYEDWPPMWLITQEIKDLHSSMMMFPVFNFRK